METKQNKWKIAIRNLQSKNTKLQIFCKVKIFCAKYKHNTKDKLNQPFLRKNRPYASPEFLGGTLTQI